MYSVEEIQKVRDSPVQKWVFGGLYALIAIVIGVRLLSRQLEKNEFIGPGFAIAIMLVFFVSMLRVASYVELDRKGIVYRNNPFTQNRKKISLDALISWDIGDHKFYNGIGYKVKPGKALLVRTKDGKQFRFGINRPRPIRKFITDNWETNTELYG